MARRPTEKNIEITERDIEIFRLLGRYRYLRSTHLFALTGGKSKKRFVERLGHLYHEGGYLNRPAQQWQAINARYMPAVYELGDAGRRVLEHHGARHDGTAFRSPHGRPSVARQYHHELMICDIISSIEIGVRADPNLRFISWREILASPKMPEATRNSAHPFAVPVLVSYACPRTKNTYRCDKPLIPDALFGIEYAKNGQKGYRFFALEADRNTEPAFRGDLQQTSYLRKILQYREIVARSIYKTRWGLPNLLVLNVTTNDRHMQNLMRLVEEVTGGTGSTCLLFKTMPSLASLEQAPLPTSHMLAAPWQRVAYEQLYLGT